MTPANAVDKTIRAVSSLLKRGVRGLRRARLLPTRYGWAYLLMLGAMLAGSINYGNNFGFLLTFLLTGVGLVSMLHTWRNAGGVVLVSGSAAPAFAGEPAAFEVAVRGGAGAGAAIEINIESDTAAKTKIDRVAEPHRRVRLHHATRRRGRMRTGPCTATSVYPLGLFRWRHCLAGYLECLVYPAPLESDAALTAADGDSPGDEAVDERRTGSDDFQGLNAYRPGDPLPRISWKASARGLGLYTKEFAGSGGNTRLLAWDSIPEADPERKISMLCGLVLAAHRKGNAYGLELPGQSIPPGGGEAHRHRCLAALADFPITEPS